jgi:hypothetical protein
MPSKKPRGRPGGSGRPRIPRPSENDGVHLHFWRVLAKPGCTVPTWGP